MFGNIARAASIVALLGAATPASAGNLRHLKNGKGAVVSPASDEPAVCLLALGTIIEVITEGPCEAFGIAGNFGLKVDQSVVNKKGKGKYTCQGLGIDFDALATALEIDDPQGPIKFSGQALAEQGSPIPCNPFDEESFKWSLKVTPSGKVDFKCNFQLTTTTSTTP